MEKGLISVIVPIYNVEKYVKRCIDSIINQTYTNLEIILVDDGSPDNCGKICDEYAEKDARIKVIHKENGGLSDARNAGIDIAKGEYIAFVDSDDFIATNMYEVLYKNIKETNSDIAIANYYKFESEDEIVDASLDEKIIVYNKEEMFNHMYDDYLLTVVAWNKLYKREMFSELRYPVGKLIEDSAIIHYLIDKTTKIVITNLQLYFYYQRTNSIMNISKVALLDELDFVYDRVKFLEKKNMKDSKVYYGTIDVYVNRFIELYCKFTETKQYPRELYKKYFKTMKKLLKEYRFSSKKRKFKYKLFSFSKMLYYILLKSKKKYDKIIENIYVKKSNKILKNKYKDYKQKVKKQGKIQYIIFNAPNHGNLGDHAIIVAEQKILEDKGIDCFSILSHDTEYFLNNLAKDINGQDIIMITGGGNFGTIWEHEQIRANGIINKFKNNKIVIFPQTIFYSDDMHGAFSIERDRGIYDSCKNLTICCREKRTYDFCVKTFRNQEIKLTTDVVTYLNDFVKESMNRTGIGVCFRKDVEKTTSQNEVENIIETIREKYPDEKINKFSTVCKGRYNLKKGKKQLIKLVQQISKSKLIVTDRLHAMIFAAITSTPCITFPNTSGKVKGVYEWLKRENNYIYFVNSIDEFEKVINEIDLDKKYEYNNKNMKESLREII
ncbi:MAG: glycosyltransferase [Clostridia bacterium]|nr:glycosyltransferase [Clostridia bacterium]